MNREKIRLAVKHSIYQSQKKGAASEKTAPLHNPKLHYIISYTRFVRVHVYPILRFLSHVTHEDRKLH